MNLHDDHLPPLWMERGDQVHWEALTENERFWQGLDERPAQPPLLPGRAARRVPAATGAPGVDRPVAPTHRMAPAVTPTSGGGPTPDGERP